MTFSVPMMLSIEFGNRWDGQEDVKVYKLTADRKEDSLIVEGLNEIQYYFVCLHNKFNRLRHLVSGF